VPELVTPLYHLWLSISSVFISCLTTSLYSTHAVMLCCFVFVAYLLTYISILFDYLYIFG